MTRIVVAILLAIVVLVPALANAQAASGPVSVPLTVKGHTIGETAAEFAAVVGVPNCEQVAQLTRKEAQRQKLIDPYTNAGLWPFCQSIASAATGVRVKFCNSFYTDAKKGTFPVQESEYTSCIGGWTAVLGRRGLEEFRIQIESPYTYADVVRELTAKYGKPDSDSVQVLENKYGAQAEAGEAKWKLPSGVIIATEGVFSPTTQHGWERYVMVDYLDHDAASIPSLPPALN